jgi:hypothetical protein
MRLPWHRRATKKNREQLMLAVYAVLTVGLLAGRQRGVGGDEACRSAEPVNEHIGSVAAPINGAEGVAFSVMKRARATATQKRTPSV